MSEEEAATQLVERLTALLLTSTLRSVLNFTQASDIAQWMLAEARRLGWTVTIEEPEGET